MPMKINLPLISLVLVCTLNVFGQKVREDIVLTKQVITGAERISAYLPFLKGKNVAVFANQTSLIGNTHLVDTLHSLGVKIAVIFGPEHGFRGVANDGQKIEDAIDPVTGAPIVSLYGNKRRPSAEDLKNVDI